LPKPITKKYPPLIVQEVHRRLPEEFLQVIHRFHARYPL